MEGVIIKNISNQYTVKDGDRLVVCMPSGKLRKSGKPLVGDRVEYMVEQGTGRIEKVLPRKNRLLRPAVANADQALVVTSCKDPDFSEHLLNRLLFLAEMAGVSPVICLTKLDLLDEGEKERIMEVMKAYEAGGHPVVITHPGSDDQGLAACLAGKTSVLCGQSGAGKSSLLNRLDPGFRLRTQEISRALGRGRHTTRHCELHPVAQGLVADTPGFSSLDFSRLDTKHLDACMPEFRDFLGQCRFKDCRHVHEPGCAVKAAVQAGKIRKSVYDDYCQIKEEEKTVW